MSTKHDPSSHHPSTLSNSIRILESVAQLGIGVTAKEIAGVLHMPNATAYRLLNALVEEEYLARTSDLRGFALGHALSSLITAATPPALCTAVRSHLADLRAQVRFAVHLITFTPSSLRVADADPDHPVRAERELVRYLHASAAGKLLLAHTPDWREPLPRGQLHPLTPKTITNLATLETELNRIRHQQIATQTEELQAELACIAIPVQDPHDGVGGALCLAGPASRGDALLDHLNIVRCYAEKLAPMVF